MSNDSFATSWDRHKGGCFYCGRPGPFSDEHVISAGLGGDDKAWMLEDCVCSVCNTQVFSRLESKLLKQGATSFMRLHEQPTTRDRKQAPTMDTVTTLILSSDNRWLVSEYLAGGAPVLLPQVLLESPQSENQFSIAAPSQTALTTFISAMRQLLSGDFPLIRKESATQFVSTPLHWEDEAYVPGKETMASKPPAQGVWMGPVVAPAMPSDAVLPWSIYQRSAGQVVCNVPSAAEASHFLSRLRLHQADIFHLSGATLPLMSVDSPQVFMRMTEDIDARSRVLTKIGLNLMAHLIDKHFVRNSDFDEAVDYVLSKDGVKGRHGQMPPNALGPPLKGHHVFVLSAQRKDGGIRWSVQLIAQLYGAAPTIVVLGECQDVPLALESPFVIQVDYSRHSVRLRTLEEHAIDVAAPFQNL